jgi:hypothetical protein
VVVDSVGVYALGGFGSGTQTIWLDDFDGSRRLGSVTSAIVPGSWQSVKISAAVDAGHCCSVGYSSTVEQWLGDVAGSLSP